MKRILAFVFSFVMIVGIVPMPVNSETINEEETVTTVEAVNETIEVEGTDEVEEAEDDVEAETNLSGFLGRECFNNVVVYEKHVLAGINLH